MLSLGSILKNTASRSPIIRGVQSAMLVEMANDIIISMWGEAGKRYARALYIKNKILTIACLSSSMAQEIKIRERELIDNINKKSEGQVVEKVRCLS